MISLAESKPSEIVIPQNFSFDDSFSKGGTIEFSFEGTMINKTGFSREPSPEARSEFKVYSIKQSHPEKRSDPQKERMEEDKLEIMRCPMSNSDQEDAFFEYSDNTPVDHLIENFKDYTAKDEALDQNSSIDKAEEIDFSSLYEDVKENNEVSELDNSNPLLESPKRRRKNIIIEATENSKRHIVATDRNFISIDMSTEKREFNIQSFEKRYEDTGVTSLSRTLKNESKFISPLKFSSEFTTRKEENALLSGKLSVILKFIRTNFVFCRHIEES